MVRTSLLVAITLLLAACGGDTPGTSGGGSSSGGSSGPGGAESPEALVEMARGFVAKEDFGGVVNLIAPDERPLMSMGMIMLSEMLPMMMGGLGEGLGGDEAKDELEKKMEPFQKAMTAIKKKHGVEKLDMASAGPAMMAGSPDEAMKWVSEQAPDLDHGAFVGDVMQALAKLGDEASGKASGGFNRLSGELTDVKIDGDNATGKIGGKPGEFRKVDGRWYFSVKNSMGGPGR